MLSSNFVHSEQVKDAFSGEGVSFDHERPDETFLALTPMVSNLTHKYFKDDPSVHPDVIQEAHLAMWKALGKLDPMKMKDNPRAQMISYLRTTAERRISEIKTRNTWTGHSKVRGKKRVLDPLPLKELAGGDTSEGSPDQDESLFLTKLLGSTELSDNVSLAYHYGEIYQALDALTDDQKRVVHGLFWEGKTHPELAQEGLASTHYHWSKAKDILMQELGHLASAV